MAGRVIVVGVDGSEDSRSALRFAVEEVGWETLRDHEARRFIEEFVERTLDGAHTGIEITAVPVQGATAAAALLEASKVAALLVVGSRGLGGFLGLLLGSVSQHCVHHAACPVVVVRSASSGSG